MTHSPQQESPPPLSSRCLPDTTSRSSHLWTATESGHLAELDSINCAEVVHLLGPLGRAKSHIAAALAVEAVKSDKSVYFIPLADLIAALAKAEREGTLREKIRFLSLASLLVVDETGRLPINPGVGNLLF